MSRLVWDQIGERLYETGVKQGVLYPMNGGAYPLGVAWNGLVSVTESPSGAESTPIYADDGKYLNLMSAEEFAATLEAYTYPSAFGQCDGSASLGAGVSIGQQSRKPFGLSYRTSLGNDSVGADYGYKIHLIYGANAAPSEKGYQTVNDSPEAITFSWELNTTPVTVTGFKPTASLVIDSTTTEAAKLTAIEDLLYGTAGTSPRLPLPDEIASILAGGAISALALSSSVPADAATAVAVGANITLTFNNKVSVDDVTLTTATGTVVPFTKTWDATGKIMTIDPNANLAAATSHLIVISGVRDIYGQSLATVVRKFTTA